MVLNVSTLVLPKSSVCKSFFGSGHKVSQFLESSGNTILNVILYFIQVPTPVLCSFQWVFFFFLRWGIELTGNMSKNQGIH